MVLPSPFYHIRTARLEATNLYWANVDDYGLNPSNCRRRLNPCSKPVKGSYDGNDDDDISEEKIVAELLVTEIVAAKEIPSEGRGPHLPSN
ncbi:jg16672 [Pararge aegeria aegeria]|uniref:Jg16672 protein n=1 Tax=Pararge aegeria aegeria TaxID=348720 RepID=A0A8S4RDV1_9NEOP|nr:jg16672 [Pararge aegeria aegeria]